jgi:hypothetical protein
MSWQALCHEGLVWNSSAYLSSGVSARGQRRLHHAANEGGCLRKKRVTTHLRTVAGP